MGVCCIVFDIEGTLFEFFMKFLNIEFFFQYFMFSSCFMLFPTLKTKIPGGGGGGGFNNSFSFHVLCYFQQYKILKSAPSLTG